MGDKVSLCCKANTTWEITEEDVSMGTKTYGLYCSKCNNPCTLTDKPVCETCKGKGKVKVFDHEEGTEILVPCPSCSGKPEEGKMEKEKMYVCPKAKECDVPGCIHATPHEHMSGGGLDPCKCVWENGNEYLCIPVEESPKPSTVVETPKPEGKEGVKGGERDLGLFGFIKYYVGKEFMTNDIYNIECEAYDNIMKWHLTSVDKAVSEAVKSEVEKAIANDRKRILKTLQDEGFSNDRESDGLMEAIVNNKEWELGGWSTLVESKQGGVMKRLVFGDGKISVCNGVQGDVPVLMFEPMQEKHNVGDDTHRKIGEQIEAKEIDEKFLTLEFHNKESVLVVLGQLLGVYFSCLKNEKTEGGK